MEFSIKRKFLCSIPLSVKKEMENSFFNFITSSVKNSIFAKLFAGKTFKVCRIVEVSFFPEYPMLTISTVSSGKSLLLIR